MSQIQMTKYNTKLFGEIFPDLETWLEFCTDYDTLVDVITDTNKEILYYLLSAKYTNNPICNWSISQFYLKMASIIFEFGPTWEKRLALQKSIRDMTDADLREASKQVYNEAYNDNTAPSTTTTEEITYINKQNVNKGTRNKLDAYVNQWNSLRSDVSEEFLKKFDVCFMKFLVVPLPTLYYQDEEDEGGNA